MYWHDVSGWNLVLMIISLAACGLVWTVVTVAAAQLIFRVYNTGASGQPESDRAKIILAERFASGEIDRDTYRECVTALRETR